MKKQSKTLLLILTFLLFQASTFAQCAMCRATATSDLEGGGNIGNGLNTGILYLMAIPYIILSTAAYFFFKDSVDAKLKQWREKIFA